MSFAVFLLLIIFINKKKDKGWKYFRSYLQIPYYGITFTAFQNFVHKVNPIDYDILLRNIDLKLIGTDLTVWFEKYTNPYITELLIISYFSYYVLPSLTFVMLLYSGKNSFTYNNIRFYILSIIFAWYSAFIFYLLIPAAGPDITFPQNYNVKIESITFFSKWYFETVTSYLRESQVRNTFPSLHFAIILIVNYFSFRYSKKYFYFCTLPLGFGLFIATLYMRQHYFIDLIGSLPVAFYSIFLAYRINIHSGISPEK